ncbi:unnamed protein product [Diplocarpon coronariae]
MSPRACRAGATESDCLGGRWDAETRPSQRASRDAYRSTARAEVNNIVVVTPVSRSARHRGESTVSGQTPGESFLKRVSHGSILSGVRRAAGRDVPGGGTAHVLAPPELSEEAVSTSLAPSHTRRGSSPPPRPGAAPASLASPFAGPKHAAAAEEHVDLGVRPPRRAGLPSETYGERGREEGRAWAPWPFECVARHRARANVGLRTFMYAAHGQEFSFVPKMEEDIWGERWVYSLRLWCKGKDKHGNTAVEKPAAAAKAEDGAASRTGGAAAASGKGASGQRASGQPASAQDANIRATVPKNQESIQGASGQGLNAQSGSTKKSGV